MIEKYWTLRKIQPSLELPSFKVRCKFNKIINKAYTILEPEHSQSNFITGEDLLPILIVPMATSLCSFHIRDLSHAEWGWRMWWSWLFCRWNPIFCHERTDWSTYEDLNRVHSVRFSTSNQNIRSTHHFENQIKSIEHHCFFNALTNFAWWTDRNGNKIEYWNGDLNPTAKGCKCAQTASCDK